MRVSEGVCLCVRVCVQVQVQVFLKHMQSTRTLAVPSFLKVHVCVCMSNIFCNYF